MKITKTLLAIAATIAVLPGCGKKNDQPAVAVAAAAAVAPIGSGQCATVTPNTNQYITFYGNITPNYNGIQGSLSAYGYGSSSYGGSNYYRNLNTGDTTNVYVSGTTAYAVLYITANTANAMVYGQPYGNYSGNAQVCGMYIDQGIVAGGTSGSGYTGTMGGGITWLWGNNSWYMAQTQYGWTQMAF